MKCRLFPFLLLVILVFSSCKSQRKESRGNETVISVSAEDAAMNEIIDNARQTKDGFIKIIGDETVDQYEASIKYPFKTDPGSESSVEHIWLTNITIENGTYYGIVANEPFYIANMNLGDKVVFDINKISDWKYVKDGYLYGGKSIKYFYDQMNKAEKEEFDSQVNFRFKEG